MSFNIDNYDFKLGSLIADLPSQEASHLIDAMEVKNIKKGDVISQEGKLSKGVYILHKGKVKIYQTSRDGKQHIHYIYRRGEFFGYRPLLNNAPSPVTAVALEDATLSFIPKKVFLETLRTSKALSNKLLENLSHEFTVWVNKITRFSQQSVKERLALSLLILKYKYRKESKPNANVAINLSREDLANYVGTAVETLVRMLQFFKEKKIIRTQGRKIVILKPEELESICELF